MSTSAVYYCGKDRRREAVRAAGTLNGIDFLEVDANQTVLTVNCLLPIPASVTSANFSIAGGEKVKGFTLSQVSVSGNQIVLGVDRPGDFSIYTLQLRDGLGFPAGFDPQLCDLEFSFKVNCVSPFDCLTTTECSHESESEPTIDYLAKDFQSFRRLLIERLTLLMPGWKQHSLADQQTVVLEMLAVIGDYLSYAQDSIATEAYLDRARKRTSVKKHARLLDYFMHEGCNARTPVCIEVMAGSTADGQALPAHTKVLTAANGVGPQLTAVDYAGIDNLETVVFETMHEVKLSAAKNKISFHTWSDFDCCLPVGATSATLVKSAGLTLSAGDLLMLYEQINPYSDDWRDQRKDHRHLVRLTKVTDSKDLFENIDVLEIEWSKEDALPFSLCLSITVDEKAISDVSVACGNVALADHGKTALVPESLIPATPVVGEVYRPTILSSDITFLTAFDPSAALKLSATSALTQDSASASPSIALTSSAGVWEPKNDLIASGAFDRQFVLEVEDDRTVTFRFGDGVFGKEPTSSDTFTATFRTGSGVDGNVGADVLCRVVFDTLGIVKVWNPLPGMGGTAPEDTRDVKRFAPDAFKVQMRAVTETDYADITLRYPGVQGASADLRWTGSWYTAFIAVDREGGLPVRSDAKFLSDLLAFLDDYRMAGVDLEIRDPIRVALWIEMSVCIKDGYFRTNVDKSLRRAFSSQVLSDGSLGYFHPDNFTFGQDVFSGPIIAKAMSVDGVDHVRLTKLQRWGQAPANEIAQGRLSIGKSEIAQLTGDVNFPERGRIDFIYEGGI
ncbi:MAG: putative baseplate assembly protein [Armatimonadetes bacterium]|nr:putative baseplate assembly protein [Armatimonadota bacterium]